MLMDKKGNLVPISEALMEFFGIKENRMLEREAVVGVWDYILDKGLVATDENGDEDIGTVYCDEKLKKTLQGRHLPCTRVVVTCN
ncbi:hypothetical protein RHGRI_021377 [Rhododendron griersonianum]|uniref:DM2 domain-containing protein n=1 Tax=Rhododendron griersonianum TaxID=479676 RepID=A0AAV6JLV9_9ERIC|nr:hypothetical protein RHGRI_021377 [Rhododendron griersonianum]